MKKPKKAMIKSKTSPKLLSIPPGYKPFLEEVKKRIRSAQLKAATSVNKELIMLYWSLGKDLVQRKEKEGWGTNLIEKFGEDIQKSFPGIEGFSRSNIFRMRAFYLAYAKVAQAVRLFEELPIFRIPWGHNITLLSQVKETDARLWYAQQTIEKGWSRSALENEVDSKLYKRQGKAITNFQHTLPPLHSELAQQTFKSPYSLDFMTVYKDIKEKVIEQALIDHIQQFLIELGEGFAFVGRQVNLHVEEEDYYIDMLFYHLKLRSYVVIEIKAREFKISDTGQINFYLSAVDSLIKAPEDKPTIGILLYYSKKKHKKITVEYALRNLKSPIGVSTIKAKLVKSLPKQLEGSLPSVKEFEEELKTIKHEPLDEKK